MRFGVTAGVAVLAIALWGCSQDGLTSGVQLAALQARFVLTEEPADAVGVLEVREALPAKSNGAHPVVLVGQIGGVPDPWVKGRATFVVADPSLAAEEEHHGHCPDGCAFCAKRQQSEQESLALVQFVDEQGCVLPVDARQLLGVEAKQMVVVRGRASVTDSGELIVLADGIYVRR